MRPKKQVALRAAGSEKPEVRIVAAFAEQALDHLIEMNAGKVVSIRSVQDGEATLGDLSPGRRLSMAIGFGPDDLNKYFLGASFMINQWFGVTGGFAFGSDAEAEGRFSFGLIADVGIVTKLIGGGGAKK